jgi:hypothetical protein
MLVVGILRIEMNRDELRPVGYVLGYVGVVVFAICIGLAISPSFAEDNQTMPSGNAASNQTAMGNLSSNQTAWSANATANATDGDIIGAGRRK